MQATLRSVKRLMLRGRCACHTVMSIPVVVAPHALARDWRFRFEGVWVSSKRWMSPQPPWPQAAMTGAAQRCAPSSRILPLAQVCRISSDPERFADHLTIQASTCCKASLPNARRNQAQTARCIATNRQPDSASSPGYCVSSSEQTSVMAKVKLLQEHEKWSFA